MEWHAVMWLTIVVFLHLVATCTAIGTIVITDLRLMATLMGYRVVIPPPERFETVMISVSLVLLYLTGGVLLAGGLAANPLFLDNPKMQAKLVLVALLTANAFVLHYLSFPLLRRAQPVSSWSGRQWLAVAGTVSGSNSLWLFSAFLGVARVWNDTVSIWFVLAVGAVAWALMFVVVNALLALASRDAPKPEPDWVDSTIARLSDFSRLAANHRPGGVAAHARSANQTVHDRRLADRRVEGPADRRRTRGWH